MIRLVIVGMTCSAYSARVQKALLSVNGVEKATVNLLTNSACVEGNVEIEALALSVKKAGYDAYVDSSNSLEGPSSFDNKTDSKERFFTKSLICSLFCIVSIFRQAFLFYIFPFQE